MKIIHKLRTDLAANTISAIVLVLGLLAIVVSTVGFTAFTRVFREEYAETTYHMADTAAALVNGNRLDDFLAGEDRAEYLLTLQSLDRYCKKIGVTMIYVIQVDRSDYGRFVSVFNPIDNTVDDTSYTEWELGHRRDTTNDEYRSKYRAIYEQGSPFETVYRVRTTDGQHPHVTSMVPVKDLAGNVTGILCIQRPFSEIREARRLYIRNVALSTVLVTAAAGALAAVAIRKRIVRPISRVSEEAARFARENTKGAELGTISSLSELQELASSIDTMETDMVNYIDNLTRATAERERITAELSLAATIQESAIPGTFPAFPDRRDFDIYASMDPARDVGGDFYNFFLTDDDHLAVVIGDVSGKGIPAALFMMLTNILIGDRTHLGGTPAEILQAVNDILCTQNSADMFVTVWLGILELSTGKLTAANAGHEYPAIRRGNGRFETLRDRHGFVVGGMEGMRYTDYELHLSPGDSLFVYTDGLTEAMAPDGTMFGMDRMLDSLSGCGAASPQQVLAGVRRAVDDFVRDAEQFDDLTMLCLKYSGDR